MSNVPPATPTPPSAPVDPAKAVGGPAMAVLIYGALLALGSILGLIFSLLGVGLMAAGGEGGRGMLNGAANIIGAIISICFSGVIIFGALKMKKLQSYGLAMAATIMCMLPCSLCCIIGLPIGIWALIVLMKPEVKAAFAGGTPTV